MKQLAAGTKYKYVATTRRSGYRQMLLMKALPIGATRLQQTLPVISDSAATCITDTPFASAVAIAEPVLYSSPRVVLSLRRGSGGARAYRGGGQKVCVPDQVDAAPERCLA